MSEGTIRKALMLLGAQIDGETAFLKRMNYRVWWQCPSAPYDSIIIAEIKDALVADHAAYSFEEYRRATGKRLVRARSTGENSEDLFAEFIAEELTDSFLLLWAIAYLKFAEIKPEALP